MLDLSFLGSAVALTKVTGNVVHGALPHFFVKDIVEERTRLFVDSIGMRVSIPSNWSCHLLSMDGILFVLFWSVERSWFVISGLAVASTDIHDSVALVVSMSQFSSVRAVNWDLMMVRSETMSMGVRVVDESALKHLAVGGFNTRHKVSWRESRLLSLSMEILWVPVEGEPSNLLKWIVLLWPDFGNVVDVESVVVSVCKRHYLHEPSP